MSSVGWAKKCLSLFEKRIMTQPCFTTASALVSAVKVLRGLCKGLQTSLDVITISAGYSTVCVHLLLAPCASGALSEVKIALKVELWKV